MIADVLGIAEFFDEEVGKRLEKIVVGSADRLAFHLKDGSIIEREWVKPRIKRMPLTPEQLERQKEGIRRSFTPERRKAMSEKMKQIRKESGSEWGKK